MQATKPKDWFRLDQKNKEGDVVEYSTDMDFFMKEQLRLVRSGSKYTFCSRLEAKTFRIETALFGNHTFSDDQIINFAIQIHKDILAGKHGEGSLVD